MAALLARRVDRDHVRVVDRRGDARLALEALAEAGVARAVGRDQLDRDGAAERELRRAIDDAHAAAAGDRLDAAAGDLRRLEADRARAQIVTQRARALPGNGPDMETTTLGTVHRQPALPRHDADGRQDARRRVAPHARPLPRGGRELRRHRRHLLRRRVGGDARAVARAPPRRGRARDQVPLPGLRPRRPGTRARTAIVKACDASLRRLGVDAIDLYQVHAPDPDVPLEATLEALDGLVRAGKVRALGVSNFPAWLLAWAVALQDREGWAPFISLQPQYSLVERSIEVEILPFCRAAGLGVIPWGPLGAGFLTGKYQRGERPPEGSRIADADETLEEAYDRRAVERNFRVVDAAAEIARERGATVPQVALAWLLGTDGVTAPIVGPRTFEQLEDIARRRRARAERRGARAARGARRPAAVYPQRMLREQIRDRRPGRARQSALSRRSRSDSSFHAPTEARSSARPGRLRIDDAGGGEPVARRPRRRSSQAHERRRAARGTRSSPRSRSASANRRASAAARACTVVPAGRLEQRERGERRSRPPRASSDGVSKRAAVSLKLAVEARRSRRRSSCSRGDQRDALGERRVDPEEAGAVGAAQPLLARGGVGDAAEPVHVDRGPRPRPARRRGSPARRARPARPARPRRRPSSRARARRASSPARPPRPRRASGTSRTVTPRRRAESSGPVERRGAPGRR